MGAVRQSWSLRLMAMVIIVFVGFVLGFLPARWFEHPYDPPAPEDNPPTSPRPPRE